MGSKARKGSACPVLTGLAPTDNLFAIANVAGVTNNAIITAANLLGNSNVAHVTIGNNAVSTANLVIRSSTVPANSTSNGVQGQLVWDSGFLYVCIANNTWRRAAMTTF